MDDKIFNGESEIFFADCRGNESALDRIMTDKPSVRDASKIDPAIHGIINGIVTNGTYKFDMDVSGADANALKGILGIDMEYPSFEQSVKIITQNEVIYKPKNLKYPHKKRKRRILKKWKKRYGFIPEQGYFIPKAQIQCDPIGGVRVTAKEI